MKSDLYSHYRKLYRKKRKAEVVSLDKQVYKNDGYTTAEIVAALSVFTEDAETEMILDDMTSQMPVDCAKVLRMRYDGYSNREIAKNQGIRVKDVDVLIERIKEIVSDSQIYGAR